MFTIKMSFISQSSIFSAILQMVWSTLGKRLRFFLTIMFLQHIYYRNTRVTPYIPNSSIRIFHYYYYQLQQQTGKWIDWFRYQSMERWHWFVYSYVDGSFGLGYVARVYCQRQPCERITG